MSFINSIYLWGMSLAVMPVIIHLINRHRYHRVKWAAMDFLFEQREDTKRGRKCKHWLILLMRILVILCLTLALCRPLVGSWSSWIVSDSGAHIFIALDRSSSMSDVVPGENLSKRRRAIEFIKEQISEQGRESRYYLVDNTESKVKILDKLSILDDELLYGDTATDANIPEMLNSVIDFYKASSMSNAEIWMVSDLQSGNWQIENSAWETIREKVKAEKGGLRIRLLGMDRQVEENCSISYKNLSIPQERTFEEVELSFEIRQSTKKSRRIRCEFTVNDTKSWSEYDLKGESIVVSHRLRIESPDKPVYGSVSLPRDSNNSDNIIYFAYEPEKDARCLLLADNDFSRRALTFAAAPAEKIFRHSCISSSTVNANALEECSLAVLSSQHCVEGNEPSLLKFVEDGGQLLLFPHNFTGKSFLGKFSLKSEEESALGNEYRISEWNKAIGPLADSAQRESLPVCQLKCFRRCCPANQGDVLAQFSDGESFLSRYDLGKGSVYYCSSGVDLRWSTLGNGGMLLPMIQRLMKRGMQKFKTIKHRKNGDLVFDKETQSKLSASKIHPGQRPTEGGIFEKSGNTYVLNRSVLEDDRKAVDISKLEKAFKELDFCYFSQENADSSTKAGSELWQLLYMLLFLFLAVDSWLTMTKPATFKEELS